tara:strand:- start:1040 stop:1222 length:183 start_codon:yes stop_codon:yes gene_type:complete
MKIGDLVKKVEGALNIGKVGVIVSMYNTESKKGYAIVEVLLEGELVKWAGHCLEVISESR